MFKHHLGIIAIMIGTLVVAGSWHTLHAQDDGFKSIMISPAVVERQVKPGETFNFDLDVRNNKDDTKTFFLYGTTFSAGGEENGNPLFNDTPTDLATAARWLSFDPPKITVPTGQTKSIKVSVTVPLQSSPGGHYLAVIISEKNPEIKENAGAQVGVQQESGTLIILSVAGTIKEEGKFLDIKPTQKIFWRTPVVLGVRFENTGDIHLKPRGILSFNRGQKKVADLEFNADGANTLPNSIRRYEVTWEPDKLFGILPAFGSYTVSPKLGFGNPLVFEDNLPTVSFLLLPAGLVKGVLIATAIFVFIFFGLFKAGQRTGRRRRRRR